MKSARLNIQKMVIVYYIYNNRAIQMLDLLAQKGIVERDKYPFPLPLLIVHHILLGDFAKY
jgi:hypothetical protein